MIGLTELLSNRGFVGDGKKVKLVRHRDTKHDLEELKKGGEIETYQQFQSKPVFHDCEQIVVFMGEEQNRARFIGVYDVRGRQDATSAPMPKGFTDGGWGLENVLWRYDLAKRKEFEELEDRLVIDWGNGALAWQQWYTDREVLEIRQRGRALVPFMDYMDVLLTFDELKHLAAQPTAHQDWVSALKAVGAIYLILDDHTGQQYVGSATGDGGLWQRWSEYVTKGHGDNARLRDLCDNQRDLYPRSFRFSILETFPRTLVKDAALDREACSKLKLGSRAFGLNAN